MSGKVVTQRQGALRLSSCWLTLTDSSDLGMELCVLGVGHASVESVELAEGVLDTWTQVLPEEGKDPCRVALETECQFRITALSLLRPQFFICKMGMLVSVLTLWAVCDNTQLTCRYLLNARHHATCSFCRSCCYQTCFSDGPTDQGSEDRSHLPKGTRG